MGMGKATEDGESTAEIYKMNFGIGHAHTNVYCFGGSKKMRYVDRSREKLVIFRDKNWREVIK